MTFFQDKSYRKLLTPFKLLSRALSTVTFAESSQVAKQKEERFPKYFNIIRYIDIGFNESLFGFSFLSIYLLSSAGNFDISSYLR